MFGTDGAYINAGGIESRGLDVAGVWQPIVGLSIYVAYTSVASRYLRTGTPEIDASVGLAPGNLITGMPRDMLVGTIDWQRGRVQTGVTYKFTGTWFIDLGNTWEVAGYANTDVYISREWTRRGESTKVNARLAINNLFNIDCLAGIAGEGAWIGARRTISFLLEIEFP